MRTVALASALVVVLIGSAACDEKRADTPAPRPAIAPTNAAPSSSRAGLESASYTIDFVAPPACAALTTCTAELRLTALGAFHINQDYPYKLTVDASSAFDPAGRDPDGKNVYSKRGGDFRVDAEKTATMLVAFTPRAAGVVAITGNLKMSVCSAETCAIDQPRVALNVIAK